MQVTRDRGVLPAWKRDQPQFGMVASLLILSSGFRDQNQHRDRPEITGYLLLRIIVSIFLGGRLRRGVKHCARRIWWYLVSIAIFTSCGSMLVLSLLNVRLAAAIVYGNGEDRTLRLQRLAIAYAQSQAFLYKSSALSCLSSYAVRYIGRTEEVVDLLVLSLDLLLLVCRCQSSMQFPSTQYSMPPTNAVIWLFRWGFF